MTDQEKQPAQEPKKKAGPIRQYATLGRGTKVTERPDSQTSERSNVGTPRSQNVETPERQDTQESERRDTGAPGHPGGTTPRSQSTQEPEQTGAKTPKRERHTIYLPPELSEWVKIRAIKTKREISELVTEAVERYKSEIE